MWAINSFKASQKNITYYIHTHLPQDSGAVVQRLGQIAELLIGGRAVREECPLLRPDAAHTLFGCGVLWWLV